MREGEEMGRKGGREGGREGGEKREREMERMVEEGECRGHQKWQTKLKPIKNKHLHTQSTAVALSIPVLMSLTW